ncbi:MAG: hypothetical protein ABJC09_11695 [Terriglobia bacterium]
MATAGQLNIRAALGIGLVEIVFVFLFVDLFDNVGPCSPSARGRPCSPAPNNVPRLNRILYSDALGTVVGATAGTSTVVSYIESSVGFAMGGRSGVTAVTTGLLFLTMIAIPLTFSIANGLALGFCAWTLLKLLRGRFREISWMVLALTALFIVRFRYMGGRG